MKTILLLVAFLSIATHARDQGFRYINGRCTDGEIEGLNPSYIGQCGDFRRVIIGRLHFDGVDMSGSQFNDADVQDASFVGTNLTGAVFSSTNLSGVEFKNAILHNVNFQGAILANVRLAGSDLLNSDFSHTELVGALLSYMKLGGSKFIGTKFLNAKMDYADLKGADLSSADFTGADLHNAVLDGAILTNASFAGANLTSASLANVTGTAPIFRSAVMNKASLVGCHLTSAVLKSAILNEANLAGANLESADLRSANLTGATTTGAILNGAGFSKHTVLPFSKEDAVKLGMVESRAASVYIIWDTAKNNPELVKFKTWLESNAVDVTLSPVQGTQMTGDEDFGDARTVLLLCGTDTNDLKLPLQNKLVQFVTTGGTFINTEWTSYIVLNRNGLQGMRDLVLLERTSGKTEQQDIKLVPGKENHPLLQGIKPFVLNGGFSTGKPRSYSTNPVEVLMKGKDEQPVIMARDFGSGHILHSAYAASFKVYGMDLPGFREILLNAINWQ